MRLSKMFGQTLRMAPAEAQVASHQLLLRAGFIRPMASGAFGFLPLARRSLDKIENLLHSNMTAIGGQEITLPTFSDSNPEETIADLVRREIRSHRQLPVLLYQTQTRCFNNPHLASAYLVHMRPSSKSATVWKSQVKRWNQNMMPSAMHIYICSTNATCQP